MWRDNPAPGDNPAPERAGHSRRQVLKGAGVLGGLVAAGGAGVAVWRSVGGDGEQASAAARPELAELADDAVSGGPGQDGIPSIDSPQFAPASEIDFLGEDDVVFGLNYRGETRGYPQPVLVWHEIVNDRVGGAPLVVTYCPLTGTTVGFTGTEDRPELTFGTTGKLVNSNLIMYDHQTHSEWPQVLGTAISGEFAGQVLTTVPLVWTTWGAWREAHPDEPVLTTDTGAVRDYQQDPYGSYPQASGYYTDEGTIFSVRHTDDRFPDKEVVLGVRANGAATAIPREQVREQGSVRTEVGGSTVRAEWDDSLATARVRRAGSDEPADFMDAMWFAWFAFYPDTAVVSG